MQGKHKVEGVGFRASPDLVLEGDDLLQRPPRTLGTSALLGPYSRTMPRALWRTQGGLLLLMSEAPLWG
jgi:hypothetical protein